jgi:type IV secretion system protein VirB7
MLRISLLLCMALVGCTKPPDLEAPCHQFGRLCPQQPINEGEF